MGSSVILPSPGQPKQGADPGFKTGAIPNVVTFAFDRIAPPASLYVQKDDQVQLTVITNLANDSVTFHIRFLRLAQPLGGQPDRPSPVFAAAGTPVLGEIILFEKNVPAGTPRAVQFTQLQLGEGFILSIDAQATVATSRGQTFARAEIFRGSSAPTPFAQLFLSDYVSVRASTSWPGSTIKHYVEGPGFIHSVNQANPAAGADWTFTVPANARMRLDSFAATFTASAAAANRQVEIVIDDGLNIVWFDDLPSNITAGQAVTVAVTQTNVPTGVVTTVLHAVIPPGVILMPGWRLRTNTVGIQGGDQWSLIWLNLEEWLDG